MRIRNSEPGGRRATWRDVQQSGRRKDRGPVFGRLILTAIIMLVIPAAAWLSGGIADLMSGTSAGTAIQAAENAPAVAAETPRRLEKKDIRAFLTADVFANLTMGDFEVMFGDQYIRVHGSLDLPLQRYLMNELDTDNARYIGIVVMDPDSGKIRAMVGHDREHPAVNPCVSNRYPAASIFKIVTAAAAVEKNGLDADSRLYYNGGKHTLYRSQIRDRKNRYTRSVSLEESFAQSINPVFGKLGALFLKKPAMETYAAAFGFNREIPFEIPMPMSEFWVMAEPYHLAEIASGFNRTTRITPVHGALLAAAAVTGGRIPEPSVVDRIVDGNGRTLYESRAVLYGSPISAETAGILKQLMEKTIESGTCRKAFRGRSKNRVLSRLSIGAKSGSIDNADHDVRFDWFVGFAEDPDGPGKIVVSAVVGHEKFIGKRAAMYARKAMERYFTSYYEKQAADRAQADNGPRGDA